MFFLDHLFSTCWTVFFGVVWWVYTPHDGQRVANSDAQRAMIDAASGQEGLNMTDAERAQAALGIWNKEKGFAAAVLVLGWFTKVRLHFLRRDPWLIYPLSFCRFTLRCLFIPMRFTFGKARIARCLSPLPLLLHGHMVRFPTNRWKTTRTTNRSPNHFTDRHVPFIPRTPPLPAGLTLSALQEGRSDFPREAEGPVCTGRKRSV